MPKTHQSLHVLGRAGCIAFACFRLKEKGRIFREAFLQKLGLLLRGTVAAPPERYGETLADEHIRGGEHFMLTQTNSKLRFDLTTDARTSDNEC